MKDAEEYGIILYMDILRFESSHIPEAAALASANYEEERAVFPVLPRMEALPPLHEFAAAGLGSAAFENGTMLGFLCFYPPWENAFTSTARGSFSPLHAHGTVPENRSEIYMHLYQAVAALLVRSGITSHSVALYAQDRQALRAFYTYGFGLRCMDAIRPMAELPPIACPEYTFREWESARRKELLPLRNALLAHLAQSPAFMTLPPVSEAEDAARETRCFCAEDRTGPVAFAEIAAHGENFTCNSSTTQNICGAYCLPAHRGKGVFQALLNQMIRQLQEEGYTRLGVDFESFNPAAYHFWTKYFTVYTHGVVRRIDEQILSSAAL